MYRCVTKDGISGDIICIGNDEGQSGKNYNDIGVWCSFNFTDIPQPSAELAEYIRTKKYMGNLLKVVDGAVVCKEISEIPVS